MIVTGVQSPQIKGHEAKPETSDISEELGIEFYE